MLRFALICAVAVACGSNSKPGGDNTAFATFQDCYDDHHTMEMFSTPCAIEICCIDHPIAGTGMNKVCGETSNACQAYLGSNLTDSADTMLGSDEQKACNDYLVDSGRSGGSGSGGTCH